MTVMEQNTNTAAEGQGSQSAKDLVRPLDGRVLAGVSLALANRYDVPLWIIRALFIVTTFFGGLGVALYAAGWLLIRSEDEEEPPAQRFLGSASKPQAWIGIVLIFVATAILLDAVTFVSAGVLWAAGLLLVGVLIYTGHLEIPIRIQTDDKEGVQAMTTTEERASGDSPAGGGTPPAPTPAASKPKPVQPKPRSVLGRLTVGFMILAVGVLAVLDNMASVSVDAEPRHYMALAVTILGLGLLVGSVWGSARWLILLGVVLVPTLLFSPAFEVNWTSESYNVEHEPRFFDDVQDDYSIGVGSMAIDLTQLDWDGQTLDLNARVDLGNLQIRIPSGVGIDGTASVDVGRVSANGRESSGIGNPHLTFDEPGDLGTVILDAQVDVGNIDIDH